MTDDKSITLNRRDFLRAGVGTGVCSTAPRAVTAQGGPYGGYLSSTSNYDGVTVDYRDSDGVVEVGATGNNGAYAFEPPAILIESGTTVTWEWTGKGGEHNVVHDPEVDPNNDTELFNSGERVGESGNTYEFTFDEEGYYPYYCTPHKSLEMKGVVVVGGEHVQGALVADRSGDDDSGNSGLLTTELAFVLGGGVAGLLGLGAYAVRRRNSAQNEQTEREPETGRSAEPAQTPAAATDDSLDTKLDDIEAHLADARDARERTAYDEALRSCRAAIDSASLARERATGTGRLAEVESALAEANRLRDEIESERKTGEKSTPSAPETIPTAPVVSLSYGGISKGELIGTGGNADVYYATAATDDGDVELALKEPRVEGTVHTETIERLLEEAETWQQLDDHDHIVSVVDYGAEPLPWIAMEYMDAGHLGKRAGTLPLPQALWTALAITKGVRHAHRRGVAHLDLKPSNVLFGSVDGAWDVPKVADWGLSKHLLEHSKSVEGISAQYAAPEQFDDSYGPPDDITDIYQLGAVFYELFTGRPPFEGQPFRVIDKVKEQQPTPPSELADVPPELDEILLTALAKSKDDRYDDIVYLRDSLQELEGSM